jgi:membrane protease YdiL (CAAX protease family)
MIPLRPKLVPFAAAVAVILLYSYLGLLAAWGEYRGGMLRHLVFLDSWLSSWPISNSVLYTLAVVAIARWWEKDRWSSIGISRPSLADPFLGVGAFLVYMDYFYIGSSVVRQLIATNFSSLHRPSLTFLAAVSLLASTALYILFEELATRAYIIERVINFTDSRLLAGLASVLVSLVLHLPGRSLGDMLRVTPIILLMTALYIWRRNILPGFIAHFAGNAVTDLILHPIRRWLLWLVIPSRNWIVVPPVAGLYLALRYRSRRP